MSKEQLHQQVASAIQKSSHLNSRRLRYEAAGDGKVILHGTVASYFEKQLAQETIREVDGVGQIDNLIQVSWSMAMDTVAAV